MTVSLLSNLYNYYDFNDMQSLDNIHESSWIIIIITKLWLKVWRKIKATPLIKKGVVVEWFNVPTWVNLKVGQSEMATSELGYLKV